MIGVRARGQRRCGFKNEGYFMDRLSTLLAQFGMHATTIFGGVLSTEISFDATDRTAKLHLLRSGDAVLQLSLIHI